MNYATKIDSFKSRTEDILKLTVFKQCPTQIALIESLSPPWDTLKQNIRDGFNELYNDPSYPKPSNGMHLAKIKAFSLSFKVYNPITKKQEVVLPYADGYEQVIDASGYLDNSEKYLNTTDTLISALEVFAEQAKEAYGDGHLFPPEQSVDPETGLPVITKTSQEVFWDSKPTGGSKTYGLLLEEKITPIKTETSRLNGKASSIIPVINDFINLGEEMVRNISDAIGCQSLLDLQCSSGTMYELYKRNQTGMSEFIPVQVGNFRSFSTYYESHKGDNVCELSNGVRNQVIADNSYKVKSQNAIQNLKNALSVFRGE